MNFLLLGAISGLDVLANAFVFSGALRAAFSVTEAADFSTMLGWAAVLSALMFGGAEQVVDHRKLIPGNALGSPSKAAWAAIATCVVALLAYYAVLGQTLRIAAILLLALILGIRSVGRAVAYAKGQYRREALLALAELGVLVGLTMAGFSIFAAYVIARVVGLPLRIDQLSRVAAMPIDRSHMWGYSFAAIAPALYFNVYYTALPALASAEIVVRFRFLQSLLVPMSFFGSLLARSRVMFAGTHQRLLRLLDVPNRSQPLIQWLASALLPGIVSLVYVAAVAVLLEPLSVPELVWTILYCTVIYHRAQLYSHITLRAGPVTRARVAMLGIVLVILSLVPIATLDDPSVTAAYAALTTVEVTLLLVSVVTLMPKRAGPQI